MKILQTVTKLGEYKKGNTWWGWMKNISVQAASEIEVYLAWYLSNYNIKIPFFFYLNSFFLSSYSCPNVYFQIKATEVLFLLCIRLLSDSAWS